MHEVTNGPLLRRDIHSLFESWLRHRHPKFRFEVDRRIKEEFENGRGYYGLHGRRFHVPNKPTARPDPVALIWHNESRYLG